MWLLASEPPIVSEGVITATILTVSVVHFAAFLARVWCVESEKRRRRRETYRRRANR